MRMNRRNVLLGLGTVVAGGGAALGTGAFSSVEADRNISVNITGDQSANLEISSADPEYDDWFEYTENTAEITVGGVNGADGVNDDAISVFDSVIELSNNGSSEVAVSIVIEEIDPGIDIFHSEVGDDGDGLTLSAYDSGNDEAGTGTLGIAVATGSVESEDFGGSLDDGGSVTVTIIAESTGS